MTIHVRVKRGRVWVELGSADHPWHYQPPDGLEEYRESRKRTLARERKRRQREREREASAILRAAA